MPSSVVSSNSQNGIVVPRDGKMTTSMQKQKIKLPEPSSQSINESDSKKTQALKLRKENQLLRKQITQIDQDLSSGKLASINEKIAKLQDIAEEYVKKIGRESNRVFDLNNQSDLLDSQIMEARTEAGGVDHTQKGNEMIAKQIKILENKLDTTSTKFNELVSGNKTLRSQIEALREERVTFDKIYKKMESELYAKKQLMAEYIELSNNSYTERDDAVEQLKVLLQKRQEEVDKYDAQLEELDEIIATDQQLNDQMKKAEKERAADILGNLTGGQDKTLKVKVIRGNWTLAEQAAKQLLMLEKLKNAQETLDKIEKGTGQPVASLIQKLEESEDTYFSMFTYVNELNTEIEELEQQIQDYQKEIESFEGDEVKRSSFERQKHVESLKLQLAASQKAIENYKTSIVQNREVLKVVAPLIQTLFEKVGGRTEDIMRLMGSSEVNENNIQTYLGVIEHRVNYLRSAYLKSRPGAILSLAKQNPPTTSKTPKSSRKLAGRNSKSKRSKLSMQIEVPPSLDTDNSDDDDSFVMPLSREELLRKEIKL